MGTSERGRAAAERLIQLKFTKEQADARIEAATKAVEAAQKALEAAIAAGVEAANKLQEGQQDAGRADQEDRIQKLVDERQAARVNRNFDEADRMLRELSSMGVKVDDKDLSWTGPNG